MSSQLIDDYKFVQQMIQYYMGLLSSAPSGNNGGILISTIEFNANARSVENILLGIEGLVAYIYYGAFHLAMPSLSGTVTQTQANNIIAIYNALNIIPPVLNIV